MCGQPEDHIDPLHHNRQQSSSLQSFTPLLAEEDSYTVAKEGQATS
jgi:hypothetical protein